MSLEVSETGQCGGTFAQHHTHSTPLCAAWTELLQRQWCSVCHLTGQQPCARRHAGLMRMMLHPHPTCANTSASSPAILVTQRWSGGVVQHKILT